MNGEGKRSSLRRLGTKWNRSSKLILLAVIGILLIGIGVYSGRTAYINKHTHTLYEVTAASGTLGLVSDPSIINQYIKNRKEGLKQEHPDVQMQLDSSQIHIKKVSAYQKTADNSGVLKQLSQHLTAYTVGVALKINGKVVANVKSKAEADKILKAYQQYKEAQIQKNAQNSVHTLSVSSGQKIVSQQVTSKNVDFKEQVDQSEVQLQPQDLSDQSDVLDKLKTGGVPEKTYTVQSGDCLSCIASNLGVSEELILQNNPDVKEDSILHIGQVLNVTQYQPLLSLKSEEHIKEVQQIPFKTVYQDDSNLGIGYTKKLSSGKYGKKQVLVDVTKVNGQVVDSKTISSKVLQQPAAAKILKGTSPVAGPFTSKSDYANRPKGNFLSWPFARNYVITSPFGWRPDPFTKRSAFHDGIDIGAPENVAIHAAASGVVVLAGRDGGFGNCVKVDNGHHIVTLYGHMRSISVKDGEHVKRGQILGHVGMTGRATGPHLHFGVYWHGRAVDPWELLINR